MDTSKENVRTLGDGMDNTLTSLPEKAFNNKLNFEVNFKPKKNILKSLKPVYPKSKIFLLVPKYLPKNQKPQKYLLRKPKEPKFIPYEPYKAAVEPIVTVKINNKPKVPVDLKPKKNNVEIHQLVTQMSEFRSIEMNKAKLTAIENNESLISKDLWIKEKESYETDIKNLRETNAHLENQLKFQAQVNSELKTLLVAAVGEDLETRVQHLTEDKLQLARALLNSANHLTSHQEQTEWLSGQCEVWRSKFLASSLMVEELARWKSAMSQRINDLQEIGKSLLEERAKINRQSLKTCNNLRNIHQNLTEDKTTVTDSKSLNNLAISSTNYDLSKSIVELLKLNERNSTVISEDDLGTQQYTNAEKAVIKLLQNPVLLANKQDAICNALLGAATSLSGQQMFLQHPSMHGMCCSHCKGEVQNI